MYANSYVQCSLSPQVFNPLVYMSVTKQTKAAPSSPDNHAVDFIENIII